MAADRAWAWNLDEMRSAAAMDLDPEAQQCEYPMVSGFTPINAPRMPQVAEGRAGFGDDTSRTKQDTTGKATKKRRTKVSGNQSAPKVRKAAGTQKGKRGAATKDSKCKAISQCLSQTKATSSGKVVPSSKTAVPSPDTLLGTFGKTVMTSSSALLGTISDGKPHACPLSRQSRPSGLIETYQAGCGKVDHDSNGPSVSTSVVQQSGIANRFDERDATDDFSAIASTMESEPEMQLKPWNYEKCSCDDFVAPTSAQGERPEDAEKAYHAWEYSSRTEADSENFFNSDDVFGEFEELDEFPTDDEGFVEIMQSVDPSGELEDADYGWRPGDFSDDLFIFEDIDMEGLRQTKASSQLECVTPTPSKRTNHLNLPYPESLSSPVLSQTSGNVTKARSANIKVPQERFADCFDDDDLEEALTDLTVIGSDVVQPQTPSTSPGKPSTPKLQWMAPKTYTQIRASQIPSSPTNVPHVVPFTKNVETLPFTRPSFPKAIRDRSPILGLHNRTVLRTCFRIGEALNAAATASRSNVDAIIELYARVVFSEREANGGLKQFFQFGDLFTDKPPFLSGTYSLWKGVGLWNVDSRVFIGEKGTGKMARVMGRVKRRERGGCEIIILSIWEADWEDVETAKGIVCS